MKLRRTYGIRRAVGPEAIATFIGKRIFEVQGVVKGVFGVEDRTTILVEDGAGSEFIVEAKSVPAWLGLGEVRARLLVQSSRPREFDAATSRLIAVAPEDAVAAVESKEAALARRAAPVKRTTRTDLASRGASSRGGRAWTLPASEVLPVYASFIRRVNRRLTPKQADTIARAVIGFSLRYGVDARLIMAMVMTESDFNPNSVSSAGAMGLGQLMPVNVRELGIRNPTDLVENLWGTVKLVRGHLDKYNGQNSYRGLLLSIAAYNAGNGAVKRYGGIPPYRETQRYVQKVIALYRRLCGS